MTQMSTYQSLSRGSKRPWELGHDDEPPATHLSDTADHDEDEREEVHVNEDMSEIKEVLQNTLDGISAAAEKDWAFGGSLLQAVNPGLTLKESGIVGLPLSTDGISRIQAVAQSDHFRTDPSPSVWKLSPDQFTLRNPAWKTYVEDLASTLLEMTAGTYNMELVGLSLEQSSPDEM